MVRDMEQPPKRPRKLISEYTDINDLRQIIKNAEKKMI